jgi:hypothetical protein
MRATVVQIIDTVESKEYVVLAEQMIRGDFDHDFHGNYGYGKRRR